MVDAFKSTLHELIYSDLILLVLDISQTIEEVGEKLDSSMHVMNELGVPMTKVVYVLNKVDLTRIEDAYDKSTYLDILDSKRIMPVSAKTGFNIDKLENLMSLLVFPNEEESRIPYDQQEEEEFNEGISS